MSNAEVKKVILLYPIDHYQKITALLKAKKYKEVVARYWKQQQNWAFFCQLIFLLIEKIVNVDSFVTELVQFILLSLITR